MNSSNEIKDGILFELAKTFELFNLSPIEARVYAYLYVEGTPLTLDELSEALGNSKTSISNGVRSLGELNLVKRVWKKGVRKDLYQAREQLYKHLLGSFSKKWIDATENRYEAVIDLQKQFDQLPEDEKNNTMNNKLHTILEFHRELEDYFKVIANKAK